MNTNTKTIVYAGLVTALITISPDIVSARQPQASVEQGVVESVNSDSRHRREDCCSGTIKTIDEDARVIVIQRPGESVPLTLKWNNKTKFLENNDFVTPATLKNGALVTVWYRTPFFGKRFATKIVVEHRARLPK